MFFPECTIQYYSADHSRRPLHSHSPTARLDPNEIVNGLSSLPVTTRQSRFYSRWTIEPELGADLGNGICWVSLLGSRGVL